MITFKFLPYLLEFIKFLFPASFQLIFVIPTPLIMKTRTIFSKAIILTLLIFVYNNVILAQCIPADSLTCPDPENNGQVCPDTLPGAVTGELYSQVATIKPPLTVGDTIVLDLHHIQLMDVENLPDNITWVSNEPNNEFMAGAYYCILLEGTPSIPGTYYLKIIVDAYVIILPELPPVNIGQTMDSTTLFITVTDPSGITENPSRNLVITENFPNPFTSETIINYYSTETGTLLFEVFDILGNCVYKKNYSMTRGDNAIHFCGENISNGNYYYLLRSDKYRAGGKMIKHQ